MPGFVSQKHHWEATKCDHLGNSWSTTLDHRCSKTGLRCRSYNRSKPKRLRGPGCLHADLRSIPSTSLCVRSERHYKSNAGTDDHQLVESGIEANLKHSAYLASRSAASVAGPSASLAGPSPFLTVADSAKHRQIPMTDLHKKWLGIHIRKA